MNRVCIIAIIGLLLVGCRQEERTDYLINGEAPGVYNGIRVYLKYADEKGREIPIDTAIVFDEKFKMTGTVKEPSLRFLTVNNVQGKAMFMLENSEINVSINKDNILESKFTGSESNNSFVAFQEGLKKTQDEVQKTKRAYRQIKSTQDSPKSDSILSVLEQLSERLKAYPLNFIEKNEDADYSLNLLESELIKPEIDLISFKTTYNKLSSRLKESEKGKEVAKTLDRLYIEYKKTENLNIGKVAPNFEAPTPNGNTISLEDIKGKVTIIDFWAAWCGPCRRENPNVVRVYETYHDQGLEIIGVSLDGQSRQKDPKNAWLEAIEKDNLSWTQVSNLKYFNDPVAKLYNINAIPATFILDKDGKIVAKNLRGRALELKVKELLAQ